MISSKNRKDNEEIHKKKTRMVNKHVKRSSTSLAAREIPAKRSGEQPR